VLLAGVGGAVVGGLGLRRFLGKQVRGESYYGEWRELLAFSLPVLVYVSSVALQGFVEPLVIKHRLLAMDAAGYYMVCRFGYIPTYLAGAVMFVLFPLLSHKHERGESTDGSFRQSLLATMLVGCVGTLLMYFLGDTLLGMLPQWRAYVSYAPFMWNIGFLATVDAMIAIYALHEIARRRFVFVWVVGLACLFDSAAMYSLFGWAFFKPFIPAGLWQSVSAIFVPSLESAVGIMALGRAAAVLGLAVHYVMSQHREAVHA
jgi:O-antigen/teichoic acid export membrane protein